MKYNLTISGRDVRSIDCYSTPLDPRRDLKIITEED